LGDFDGRKFIPEEGLLKYNHSDYFYASQTFNNVPMEDGRRIQMAWGTVDFPEMPFNQMMLFPVSLTLRNTTNGVRMFANPVNELEKLYDSMKSYTDIRSQPGEDLLECFNSGSYDISMDVSSSSQGNIIFEANGREINFDLDRQTITSGDLEIDYQSKNFEMNVRLLVDIKTIEVYLNDGEINMPLRIDGKIDSESISLTSDMPVNIQELKVRTLRSVWN
jgi:sucrose-6-phosphate hydrolase SacC (GH32 family)